MGMFFLESKTTPGSLSFYCVIALEYSLSFSDLSGEPRLHPVSIQRKEMKFPLMMFGWAVMSVSRMKKKWYDGINEEVSVEENDVLVKFLHPTDPSVYLHWPAIEVKSWVPVYHRLQLLSIPTVNFSGALIPSPEIQSFIHLPIENCSSTSNSFIIIGNF